MYEMWYYSPDGKDYCLTGNKDLRYDNMFLMENGIDGLVGEAEDSISNPALFTGQRFYGLKTNAMTGELKVLIYPEDGTPIDKVYKEFRSSWSRSQYGTLTIVDTDSEGVLRLKVRLRNNMSAPTVHPGDNNGIELNIPVISDGGVWNKEHISAPEEKDKEKTRKITIHNYGDVFVRPKIVWDKNSSGEVIVPSGASFNLPAVDSRKTLYLDNSKSNIIVDEDNNVDRKLTMRLAQEVYSEGVPPAQSRDYIIPRDALMIWDIGLFDPWR